MANEKKSNGPAIAAMVGSLVALLAVGGSIVSAMVTPMNQRIDTQNEQLREFKIELRRVFDRERADSEALATMNERFKEVETQFRLFQEVNATKFSDLDRRLTHAEIDGNPRHDERIKNLERANGIRNGGLPRK